MIGVEFHEKRLSFFLAVMMAINLVASSPETRKWEQEEVQTCSQIIEEEAISPDLTEEPSFTPTIEPTATPAPTVGVNTRTVSRS